MNGIWASVGKRPLIVGSIGGKEKLDRSARRAAKAGADLIEVRIDSLPAQDPAALPDILSAIKESSSLPMIATVRSLEERGSKQDKELTAEERKALFKCAMPWVEFADIEISSADLAMFVVELAHKKGKRAILSYHNFRGMPGPVKAEELAVRFKSLSGDILKLAGMPSKDEEVTDFLETCRGLDPIPRVFIAMGKIGQRSRIEGFAYGSCFSYGYVDEPFAPGQFSVAELAEEFRRRYGA